VSVPVDLAVDYERLGPRDPPCQPVLDGDRRRFGRVDMVEEQWRSVSRILQPEEQVHLYGPGSCGPAEADALAAPIGGWHEPAPMPQQEPRR
jgi:glucose-6-phosphate 1-dehydrogenase